MFSAKESSTSDWSFPISPGKGPDSWLITKERRLSFVKFPIPEGILLERLLVPKPRMVRLVRFPIEVIIDPVNSSCSKYQIQKLED